MRRHESSRVRRTSGPNNSPSTPRESWIRRAGACVSFATDLVESTMAAPFGNSWPPRDSKRRCLPPTSPRSAPSESEASSMELLEITPARHLS